MSQAASSSSARLLWNKIATKLGIAVATLLIPAIVLTYLLYANINDQINFARGEVFGAEYLTYCRNEVAAAVEHRRLVADYLTGGPTTPNQLAEQQAKVKENFDRIEEIDRKLTQQTGQIHTRKAIEGANEAWQSLTTQLAAAKPGDLEQAREVLLAYDKYLASFLDVMVGAADGSKLTLDPEYGAYGLMNTAQKALQDANLQGRVQWRAVLAAAAKEKGLSTDRKFELAQMLGTIEALKGDLDGSFDNLAKERPNDITPALKAPRSTWDEKRKGYLEGIDTRIIRSEKIELAPQKLAESGSETRAATFALFDVIQPLLVKDLDTRLAGFRRTLLLGFTAITVGLLLALGVVFVITRGFTRQIRAYLNVFAIADKGDYTARVEKITSDELGEMTLSLNNVLGTTDTLIKKQKAEYDELQHSIMKLLEDVSGAADGDLTCEAEVTADATGAIADSFNHMLGEMRKIIGNVQDATMNVSASATQIQAGTEQLVSGSEHQAEQIVNTSTAIDEMAVSIQQVSDNANVAAGIAKDALTSAQKGNESVSNTIAGMSRIREQSQETAKRIKRLGESSQEIGQIIQLIEDIADRTSILALNASIQAAAAGEAGRGFAVVAAEVERLAERSTDATKKIASLIKTIQSETNEAVGSMEKSINEVVEGSKLANQAGQSLEDIQNVSKRLAELIHSISLAANQQARGSDELAKSMGEISTITQDTAQGTKQAADSVSQLAALADDLRASVSSFKLPDQPANQPKPQPASNRVPNSNGNGNGQAHAPSRALVGAR